MNGRSLRPHNSFLKLLVGLRCNLEFPLTVVGRIYLMWACNNGTDSTVTTKGSATLVSGYRFSSHHRVQTGSEAYPESSQRGTEVCLERDDADNYCTPHPNIFVAWCLIKRKDNFTFIFIIPALHKLQSELSIKLLQNSIAQKINKRHKMQSSLNANLKKGYVLHREWKRMLKCMNQERNPGELTCYTLFRL